MSYKYVACTAAGALVKGTLDVETEAQAKEALRKSGYRPVNLKYARPKVSLRRSMPTLFRVKIKDVVVFSRQMSSLVGKGINVVSALRLLRDNSRNALMKDIMSDILKDIQEGISFAQAIGKYPKVFPPIYCRMIQVSEQTGNLEGALKQTADYLEREMGVLKKVQSVMIYPAFILALSAGVTGIMIVFTLPPLVEMFAQFEADLPLITRLFLGFGSFLSNYMFYLLAIMAGLVGAGIWFVKRPTGRKWLDMALLKIPLLGPINTLREVAHFARTTSLLLSGGLSMPDTMEMAIQTTNNSTVRGTLTDIHTGIMKGYGLTDSMSSSDIFPPIFIQMVKISEQTGMLNEDLMAIAESYEQDVDERVNSLLTMLEPCLLIGVGLGVGVIAVSVIMPIYTMMGQI